MGAILVESGDMAQAISNNDKLAMADSGLDFASMVPGIFGGVLGFTYSTSYAITDNTFGPYLASGIADFLVYEIHTRPRMNQELYDQYIVPY